MLQEVKISLEILLILRGLPILLTRTEEIEYENDGPNTILSKRMGRPNEQSWTLVNISFVYLHMTECWFKPCLQVVLVKCPIALPLLMAMTSLTVF